MSLSDYTPEIEEITIPARRGKKAGSFNVRGLSFHDISKIIRVHYHDLDGLFDLYQKTAGEDLTAIATGRFAVSLVSDAPGLVAHVIALAADEEAELEKVQTLPLLVQFDALKKIAGLTFSDVEEVKKDVRSGNGADRQDEGRRGGVETRSKREIVLDFHNNLRATVSFLMSEGHPAARHYPLGYLWSETKIAKRRVNAGYVTQSLLMQSCIGAVLNGKKGGKEYKKLIKELSDG
ncbi:tail length tape measure protein [Chivirus chi]|uniref:Tail assembly chaperone n=3 Tax=root TaxID=1 RepID=A0A097P478_9CAUD|nr:tail length tape measure protein [Chivirus chi]YP_009323544.1 tail length tape measure protein [Salmonella phage 118970_sal1]AIU37952.1 tail assembly chaperone [Chivirus chi]AOE45390.1 tail assembly chaperone [Salmonella phage 118970_sal1]